MKIENAKTTFFNDKEQYLNFRKAWAVAVNSPEAKSHLEVCDEAIKPGTERNPNSLYYKRSKGTGRRRVQGWITASHMILYNLLREKNMENGFTNVTNEIKLQNGMLANHGLYFANQCLLDICRIASMFEDPTKVHTYTWWKAHLEDFLRPFAGTVTIEMLGKLSKQIPEVKYVYCRVAALKKAGKAA